MPGSTPATSQLDWLSSTTAMIVLSWSKATRDLLKSFTWGLGPLRQLFASDDGAISSPPAPYHLSAGGTGIRTPGPLWRGKFFPAEETLRLAFRTSRRWTMVSLPPSPPYVLSSHRAVPRNTWGPLPLGSSEPICPTSVKQLPVPKKIYLEDSRVCLRLLSPPRLRDRRIVNFT